MPAEFANDMAENNRKHPRNLGRVILPSSKSLLAHFDRVRSTRTDNRKEIIERLWKGRQERVRKGKTPGGNAPYGYRRESKKLVEEEREAEIVRLIFSTCRQYDCRPGDRDDVKRAKSRATKWSGMVRPSGAGSPVPTTSI
jgi:hypothetical protein